MDLRLLHLKGGPYWERIVDRRIARTSAFHCEFYEWSGWYYISVPIRLLGHYRLFQRYKSHPGRNRTRLATENAYIWYFREKSYLYDCWPHIYLRLLKPILVVINKEVQSINHDLLYKRPDILINFLVAAETDFDKALLDAMEQINDPAFLSEASITNLQVAIHENHQYNTSLSKHEFHVHPVVREQIATEKQPKGKEKNVFSKKQLLLFFDLLHHDKKLEPLDLNNPQKTKAIAHLLQAISGKVEDSWLDELDKYRRKDLYTYHADGERQELIRILINLRDKCHAAGLHTIVKAADKKIIELEHAAP